MPIGLILRDVTGHFRTMWCAYRKLVRMLRLFFVKTLPIRVLALTRDFKTWRRLGRLTQSNLDDRDVILFPEKINGKFAMLHRPKEWIGEAYGLRTSGDLDYLFRRFDGVE